MIHGMSAPALTGTRQDRTAAPVTAPTAEPQPQLPSPQTQTAAPDQHRRPWLRWLVTLVIFALLAGGIYWLFANRSTGDAAAGAGRNPANRVVPIRAEKAILGDMPIYLTGLGSVTPLNTVVVRSRVDGELVEVRFKEAQDVTAGEILAQIDPEPFKAQISQAQGQLAKDTALMNNAQADVDRYTKAGESVSKQQLETAEANVKQYAGAVEADKGALRNAQLQLEYATIRAPISGRIGFRAVDKGNMIHASDANGLAVINQLKPITIVFTVPQDDIPKLRRRLDEVAAHNQGKAEDDSTRDFVAVDAFDRDQQKKLASGKLLAVDNQVDPNSGTIRIKAVFTNEPEALFPNQYVNARMLVDLRHDVTLLPAAAVQRGPDSAFVYVVKKDDTIEVRKVRLGDSEGERVVVEKGLAPGEVVATDGVDKLQAGTKVRVSKEAGDKKRGDGAADAGGATRPAGRKEGGRGRGVEGEKNPSTQSDHPLTPSPNHPRSSPATEATR